MCVCMCGAYVWHMTISFLKDSDGTITTYYQQQCKFLIDNYTDKWPIYSDGKTGCDYTSRPANRLCFIEKSV